MLQELDECLIQQATIAKIDRPSPYNLEMLRRWLDSSTKGKGFLVGLEEETWKEIHSHDFLAIPRPEKDVELDRLSKMFLGPLVAFYHTLVGRYYKVIQRLPQYWSILENTKDLLSQLLSH